MPLDSRIRRGLHRALDRKYEKRLAYWHGITGNYAGTVVVPNRRGYIYVRDWVGVTHIVYNDVAPVDQPGYRVACGYDPFNEALLRVLGMSNPYVSVTESGIGAHHTTHEWPGNDVVWVQSEQIVPGLIIKKTGMTVGIYPFWLQTVTGTYIGIPYQQLDLTAYVPTVGACWALIYFSSDGLVHVDASTTASDLYALKSTPIGALADPSYAAVGAVALAAGQTEITQTKEQNPIVDLRWFNSGGITPGDMFKSVYDTDDDGVVNDAETARALRGRAVTAGLAPVDGHTLIWSDALSEYIDGVASGGGAGDLSAIIEGALVTGTGVVQWVIPRGMTISKVYIVCKDPGTAGSTIIDVNIDGVTIFTTQANRPELAYDDVNGWAVSGIPDVTALVEGSIVSFDIDQLATGAAGLRVVVAIANDGIGLSDDDPEPDGSAAAGVSVKASRSDHVHPGDASPYTPFVPGDFSWVNQGTGSLDTSVADKPYLLAPAVAGDQLRILKKSAPSTPYTITLAFMPHVHSVNYNQIGFAWRQSSDGKLVTCHITSAQLAINNWNSPTSFSSNPFAVAIPLPQVIWLKCQDDGANRICSWSMDGMHFHQVFSIGRTSFLTADEVGIFADSNNGTYPAGMTVLSWEEG